MVNEEKQKKKQDENKGKITFTVQGKKEEINKKEEMDVEKKDSLKEGEIKEDEGEDVKIEDIEEGGESISKPEKVIKKIKSKKDNQEVRIKLNNVSKRFNGNYQKNQTALARLLSFFKGENKKDFWALENISFKIKAGENLGIIGKNGSGKSTLLRAIAGVYKIEEGDVWTRGQLVYLTGFGHGLQPRLTMKENIFLVGSVMGLGQPDIKERFDDIVEFAGLKEHINTKLFKFSSGMQTRLASSIGLHCVAHRQPDILLVDEVIGGGADKEYQEKSLKKMEELLKGGSTVVLVSHNLDAIKKYCDRVIWLEEGRIRMEGGAKEVVECYESDGKKRIVIAGLPKTGTTALAYKVKNSISKIKFLFEPKEYQLSEDDLKRNILAKILLHRMDDINYDCWNSFNKKILIVRDPRDRVISDLLYRIKHSNFYNDKKKVKVFIDLLKKKESNSESVTMIELLKTFLELNGENFDINNPPYYIQRFLDFFIRFHNKYKDYFIVKYEDFIDNKLERLEKYLGFELKGEAVVPLYLKRVIRTKSYDNWRDWFTKEDIEFFRPLFLEYMKKYDYKDEWRLNKKPKILPEHCSGYVKIIMDETERENKKSDDITYISNRI